MIPSIPDSLKELRQLLKTGEGSSLEFKRSTGELKEGLQTACAFLNGNGGMVIFGVRPDSRPEGQQVVESTLRDITQAFDRFEPPVDIPVSRLAVGAGRDAIILRVAGVSDSIPFTFDGRPYERVGNTTRKMSQEKYERLLLQRAHSKRRWENQSADEITLKEIDREEVFRIVDIARSAGRLVGPVGRSLPDVLGRLGVYKGNHILRAAVVLFARSFLPDYPQCELRMARFRGIDKAEFMDQRQIRGPAFKLLEEAELFCQRHFPLPGKIVPGRFERVDIPLIPPDGMREILVNAFIHRDYSIAGGAVSLAIFDDRVEIWSAGTFPIGITPEMLSREHPSVQRNPIIADVFFRAGLIERWGRGTNRVGEMCRTAGIKPPEFAEIGGSALVTFRVPVGTTDQKGLKLESQPEIRPESQPESISKRILKLLQTKSLSKADLSGHLGQKAISGQLNKVIRDLLAKGLIEYTIPDKPNSRLQKYRITADAVRTLQMKEDSR